MKFENHEQFLATLDQLHNQQKNYVYRGHERSSYILRSKIFRSPCRAELFKDFVQAIKPEKIEQWLCDTGMLQFMDAVYQDPFFRQRFLDFCLFIMQYNNLLNDNPSGHWRKKDTLIHLVNCWYLPVIQCVGYPNVDIVKPSQFHVGSLVGVSENFPQHYDIPTAALDWTRNPYIAISFALGDKDDIPDSEFLSVYVFRLLNHTTDDSPIILPDEDALKKEAKTNLRLKRQEGTFIYFNQACEWYLRYGSFPCVEDYQSYNPKLFELIRLDLRRSTQNKKALHKILDKKGLTKEYLLPPR